MLPFRNLPHRGRGVCVHTLNDYGEIKVDHHPILTSTLDVGKRSGSGLGQRTAKEST